MALSDADTARLATLQAAYDALISGQNTVRIQAAGRMRELGQGDTGRLREEIDQLLAAQAATGTTRRRGAIRFRIR